VKRLGLLAAAFSATAFAYIQGIPDTVPFHRPDYGNIQFLVNQNIAAGLKNASGTVWITADSDPLSAIAASFATWNAVTTTSAHFAPTQPTAAVDNPKDGQNVISFTDDNQTLDLLGGALAFTVVSYQGDGTITDTDIIFSPNYTFSTTNAPGAYDLQSVLTHELGHSLGADHTGILGATMFQYTQAGDTHQRALSPDDIAFVGAVYPPIGGTGYGILSGYATLSGAPLPGGLITAVDPSTGITIGGFSSVVDGGFSIQAPPGNYYVYVEPMGQVIAPGNLYMNPLTNVDEAFESTFVGGNAQPTLVPVAGGVTASVSLAATPGTTALTYPYIAFGAAGALGDLTGSISHFPPPVSSGQAVDLIFSNPGIGSITEANIQLLGPATLRKGSLRQDIISLTGGTAIYRFTLDIPPLAANAMETIVFRNGADILTESGILTLTRPQAVNAASYQGGAVAPGEILSFFGNQLGPVAPLSNAGFDSTGKLPASLGNVSITFDKVPAPLFYVSGQQVNLQVPYEVAGKSSTLMTFSYNGSQVLNSTLTVASAAPGIFVVTNADGSANTATNSCPVGGIIVLYGTGGGVAGTAATGSPSPTGATVPALVTINGKSAAPVFAGLTSGSVGLMQINVAIPAGTPTGTSVPVQVGINGSSSQKVYVWVR
jgi:uncharacterized protein (TIGR03437 family)